ncbi:polysaccharide deacetylase family protein [Cytobacillus oceanisediminis]|uniref:polysaccharide deacetylase family protein n=1 Tax=Cytobacillus oceanisediminis TaxID=665099 RepID=UPI003736F395
MPQITAPTREDSGRVYLEYSGTATTTSQNFTFSSEQNGMTFRNKSAVAMTLTVDGVTHNIPPYATIEIDDNSFSSFDVKSATGSQKFEIKSFLIKNSVAGLADVRAQLAEKAQQIIDVDDKANRAVISRRNRKPMITILDDDGRTDVLTKWLPILQEKTFKMDIAVITGWVGNTNYMTWEQLEDLKTNYNVDLVNHTHTHPALGDLATEAEVRQQFKDSTDILKARGHSYDVMVYPFGSQSATVRQVAREYCRAGIYIQGGVAYPPLNTFKLPRQILMPETGSMDTVESYTAYIDEAVANNGWIIFMSHSQYAPFDGTKIRAIIDYANSAGIEWVHVKEGLERIGNLIDVGDYDARTTGSEYTVLDANGVLHSKTNSIDFTVSQSGYGTFGKPITDFPISKKTVEIVLNSGATGFPNNKGGILETFRGASDSFSYQTYKIYDSNSIYKRRWNTTTSIWNAFELLMTQTEFDKQNMYVVKNLINQYTADTPITDFPANKITTFAVNTSGATGFPNNTAGLVTTYNVMGNGWHRQEYRKYLSNEVWSRHVDGTGAWTAWVKISAV